MDPHAQSGNSRHHPRHRRSRPKRYRFAGLAGAVCTLIFILFCVFVGVFSAMAQGETPATESRPQISCTLAEESSTQEQSTVSTAGEKKEAAPWYLRLVNKDVPLPKDFSVEVTEVAGGQFDSRAADALSQMLKAMEDQGLSPLICSSFRTWEEQDILHQEEIEQYLEQGNTQEEAEVEASKWVVPAGASEHELGLAVDIVSAGYQMLNEGQENTAEQQWLMAHCQEYGFILRYPASKADLTDVGYEPWHYRYVGKEAAQEIMEQGLCLEEYWAANFGQNSD